MNQYNSVHFFLDESGQLTGKARHNEPMLVGGLLIFGNYAEAEDSSLRAHLRQRLQEVDGRFPEDLHFGRAGLDFERQERFLRSLSDDLRTWAGEDRMCFGINIVHCSDVFGNQRGVLGEQYYDNRYLSMLWSLIEHLVFVDEKVAERLMPDSAFHLHIASRVYCFDPKATPAEEIESLGWKVLPDRRNPGRLVAVNVVQERDLVTMLRMSLRQRWGQPPICLGTIEVTRLDYDRGASPAALYLADLYLGQIRFAELASRRRFRPPVKSVLLPTFRRVEYGPWLELLARMQAAVRVGDIEQYLANADEYQSLEEQHDLRAFQPIVRRQEKAALPFLRQSGARLVDRLEKACAVADAPGGARRGLLTAEQAGQWMHDAGIQDLRADVLLLQARLSHANHTGDTQKAQSIWQDYLALEPRLHGLGAEGLRIMADMRNRWAVSLTDRFQYEQAEEVLAEVACEREDWAEDLAKRFGITAAQVPNWELGACLGSLGQLYAFIGTAEKQTLAESCFRRAMNFLTDVRDIERQWVYLGHLACDLGEAALWQTVLQQLKTGAIQGASQFILALQLKGLTVFGASEEVRSAIERWEQEDTLRQFSEEDRQHHPFGLIHQAAAMLYARAWRETGKTPHVGRACEQFDVASRHMREGGSLLKFLSYVAQLRKYLLVIDASPTDARAQRDLVNTFLALRGHLAGQYGDHAWSEDEHGRAIGGIVGKHDPGPEHGFTERMRSLLKAIRFNYW